MALLASRNFILRLQSFKFIRIDRHNRRIPILRQWDSSIHLALNFILAISLGKFAEYIGTPLLQ